MMTDKPNNGGPAFPVPEVRDAEGNGITEGHPGMSLRDWFAGQALAGYLVDPNVGGDTVTTANRCYVFADAMLKARGDQS